MSAEHGQEIVFRRHLVLRFHADVINLARLGIGVHDKFRAAAAQGRAVERRRRRRLRAVDDSWKSPPGSRLVSRLESGRSHTDQCPPPAAWRWPSESAKTPMRGIESVGGRNVMNAALVKSRWPMLTDVGDDVEMPLVGHAERDQPFVPQTVLVPTAIGVRAQQRRVCADKLVQQRRVRGGHDSDVLVAGGIGDDAVVRDRERVGHLGRSPQEITSA